MSTGLVRINTTKNGQPSHYYKLDGKRVRGVTTIINEGVPKTLTAWAAEQVAAWVYDNPDATDSMVRHGGRGPWVSFARGLPFQRRDDAAVIGTDVHAYAERVVRGEAVDVPVPLAPYVQGYVRFLDHWQVEPTLTEYVVASRAHQYAGTSDGTFRLRDGRDVIVDIKTGRNVYGSTALQLAAYRFADFRLKGDREVPVPDVDDTGLVLHVRPDMTEVYPLPVGKQVFEVFLAAASVADFRRTERDLLGAAVDSEREIA